MTKYSLYTFFCLGFVVSGLDIISVFFLAKNLGINAFELMLNFVCCVNGVL